MTLLHDLVTLLTLSFCVCHFESQRLRPTWLQALKAFAMAGDLLWRPFWPKDSFFPPLKYLLQLYKSLRLQDSVSES